MRLNIEYIYKRKLAGVKNGGTYGVQLVDSGGTITKSVRRHGCLFQQFPSDICCGNGIVLRDDFSRIQSVAR